MVMMKGFYITNGVNGNIFDKILFSANQARKELIRDILCYQNKHHREDYDDNLLSFDDVNMTLCFDEVPERDKTALDTKAVFVKMEVKKDVQDKKGFTQMMKDYLKEDGDTNG